MSTLDKQDAPLDTAALMETVAGDVGLIRELTAIYLEDTPPLMLRIRKAVGRKDGPTLWQAAHRLKGTATGFHAGPLRRAAFRLELMGQDNDFSTAESALDALETEVERFERALLEWETQGSESR